MSSNPTIMAWKCTVTRGRRTAFRALTATRAVCCLTVSAAALSPAVLRAQGDSSSEGRHEIFAGSELETYIRLMQLTGRAAQYPWSLRPFSPIAIDSLLAPDSAGPWSTRYALGSRRTKRAIEWGIIPPTVSARFNSSFPYGMNDGPIWAGRGLTASLQAGFFARLGPISLTIAPMAFRAQNASFAVAPAGAKCPPACANLNFPTRIDLPQRFGSGSYGRIDPGQSTLRVDLFGISAGVTTANEWWGPAQLFPYLLGNNAPGFPHAFFGTERPLNVFIGRLHARVLYGRLDQSEFSPVTGSKYFASRAESGRIRFASGVMTVFEPRGLTGLEIGIGRFYHSTWPSTGIPRGYWTKPLKGPLGGFYETGDLQSARFSNQLASGFARWVFPRSHVEIYGEYGAEDSHADFRAEIQEPDYTRSYSLGLQKAWNVKPTGFDAFLFELMNYQAPAIARYRADGVTYVHDFVRQGHTNRGQLLGAGLGAGAAAGSTLAWNRYTATGRTTVAWDRIISQESGTFYGNGVLNPRSIDISHALRVEKVRFFRLFDVTSSAAIIREFNRNFAGDAWNLNASLTARYRLK